MTKPPRAQQSAGRRSQVLQLLRKTNEPLGIAEIADQLGIHANTVRFHLDTLVDNRQVERMMGESGTPGRPPQLFRTVPGMDPMGPRHYRVLAEALVALLASDPEPSRRAAEAGRLWGRLQASTVTGVASRVDEAESVEAGVSVDWLIGMLEELDFAPEQSVTGDRSQIGLRNCPFLDLAVDRSEVVCPVHLGLMQGAMESWKSPVSVERLVPFAEPDLCMVHLGGVGAS
ncbi:Predicted transcriptional regulator, ArsR family [Brevibacterium sp. Mu109]|uniref:helix-turn-helix transcriptional regulator n=1 Tax=Brevibacterium sp. Mu109 TaxID=1255669 RepID=UPI000C641B66|nr:helix-turn-helix domain-containing protein [Brevibacterium sp. Mu109]MDN5895503.1 helix-turn-helix domain-containing protein [Nocardioides sp.]SMX86731.1 Predicted transcriptional regulator, ArsR family [Brevibacterium sp. Mu109]